MLFFERERERSTLGFQNPIIFDVERARQCGTSIEVFSPALVTCKIAQQVTSCDIRIHRSPLILAASQLREVALLAVFQWRKRRSSTIPPQFPAWNRDQFQRLVQGGQLPQVWCRVANSPSGNQNIKRWRLIFLRPTKPLAIVFGDHPDHPETSHTCCFPQNAGPWSIEATTSLGHH